MHRENQTLKRVYLDYNATTPPYSIPRSKFKDWTDAWGNPSSIHWAGRNSKNLIRQARENLAKWIGANPSEIILTSGGSESNNLAIKGFFLNRFNAFLENTLKNKKGIFQERMEAFNWFLEERKKNQEIDFLISSVEHPSVFQVAENLKAWGLKYEVLPLKKDGSVDIEDYKKKLEKKPKLVSFMIANNETGNIFPVKKLAHLAHKAGILFHCDAVQALGKMPFHVKHLGIDLASFSGHKFYALKGAGFLYIKGGVKINPLTHGGAQERGFRAGTENIFSIASMGFMAEYFDSKKDKINQIFKTMENKRNAMEKEILNSIEGVSIVGKEGKRLPNTSYLIFKGLNGESLLMNLDLKGFALSSGSACSSGTSRPSTVLQAMGYSLHEAQSSLRVSIGFNTKKKEINSFLKHLIESVKVLRQAQKAV